MNDTIVVELLLVSSKEYSFTPCLKHGGQYNSLVSSVNCISMFLCPETEFKLYIVNCIFGILVVFVSGAPQKPNSGKGTLTTVGSESLMVQSRRVDCGWLMSVVSCSYPVSYLPPVVH